MAARRQDYCLVCARSDGVVFPNWSAEHEYVINIFSNRSLLERLWAVVLAQTVNKPLAQFTRIYVRGFKLLPVLFFGFPAIIGL